MNALGAQGKIQSQPTLCDATCIAATLLHYMFFVVLPVRACSFVCSFTNDIYVNINIEYCF